MFIPLNTGNISQLAKFNGWEMLNNCQSKWKNTLDAYRLLSVYQYMTVSAWNDYNYMVSKPQMAYVFIAVSE